MLGIQLLGDGQQMAVCSKECWESVSAGLEPGDI